VRRRIERILENLKPQPDGISRAETQRGLRVVQVLERIGTKEAERVLRSLAASDPPTQITAEAKEALERLGR
jgi:hypothetical protein